MTTISVAQRCAVATLTGLAALSLAACGSSSTQSPKAQDHHDKRDNDKTRVAGLVNSVSGSKVSVTGKKGQHPRPQNGREVHTLAHIAVEDHRHVRQPHQIQHTETGGTGEGDARGAFAAAAEPASYISCGDKAEQEAERIARKAARHQHYLDNKDYYDARSVAQESGKTAS